MLLHEIKHQPAAVELLLRAVERGRLHHALIFHGPAGVGRNTLALAFAQRLLCKGGKRDDPRGKRQPGLKFADENGHEFDHDAQAAQDACGACDACHLVEAGNHPDLLVIHRHLNQFHPDRDVQKRKAIDLSVDVIRHFLIGQVGRRPAMGPRRIFIVKEADRMTTQAQNALLKTLEEPPGATLIILITEHADRLLATVRSRCQSIPFRLLPREVVEARLRELNPELGEEPLRWCAAYASGSVSKAAWVAQNGLADLYQRFGEVLFSRDGEGFSFADFDKSVAPLAKAAKTEEDEASDTEAQRLAWKSAYQLWAAILAGRLRDCVGVAIASGTGTAASTQGGMFPAGQAVPSEVADEAVLLAKAIQRLARAESDLDRNAHVQLCTEVLLQDLNAILRGETAGS